MFRSDVSATTFSNFMDDLPEHNSSHHKIVLPQSTCIQLTDTVFITGNRVLLLQSEQRQDTDQDGARFMSAERQSVLAEREFSSISEVRDEDISLHRTLAKPEEESEENSQRALSGSVALEMEVGRTHMDNMRLFTCQSNSNSNFANLNFDLHHLVFPW